LRRIIVKVIYQDMGKVFNPPFRFLPYCPACKAEISTNETPCHKCGESIEWFDPYEAEKSGQTEKPEQDRKS
jgi:hypothetical protein